MNLYEGIKNNSIDNYLKTDGLDYAKEYNMKKGNLNNCKDVSEFVINNAPESIKEYLKPIEVRLFSDSLSNKQHFVILVNDNYLVDYTQKQYLGSNNPTDTEYKRIDRIGDYFKDDKNNITYYF